MMKFGLSALIVVLISTISLQAQLHYSVTDLGDLPGGEDYSVAWDINDSGQIVGHSWSNTGRYAFIWENGVMTDLGGLPGEDDFSEASGINNFGQVVVTGGSWHFNHVSECV